MNKWIDIKDQLPAEELMCERDVLIFRENGTFGVGVFYYDQNGNIRSMSYNGTNKHIDLWKFKPTHWMDIEPPNSN